MSDCGMTVSYICLPHPHFCLCSLTAVLVYDDEIMYGKETGT